MARVPAWKLLVDKGLFSRRDDAERWILSGKVLIGDTRIDKPGQIVPVDSPIRIKGYERRYVSRGGEKLHHAIEVFKAPIAGAVALDCGASTGGFTDCLLQHGASRVYAVDAGFGQLSGKLRADPRVTNMESTNISDARLLALSPKPDLVTLDLSYLSLKTALPIAAELLNGGGFVIALVKPLFEVQDNRIRRTGVISDRAVYVSVLQGIVELCRSRQYPIVGLTHSPIRGTNGTEEYFLAVDLRRQEDWSLARTQVLQAQIQDAVRFWERGRSGTGD